MEKEPLKRLIGEYQLLVVNVELIAHDISLSDNFYYINEEEDAQ